MSAFENLPDPREDGLCIDCEIKNAVTRDNRFCKKCLRVRLFEDDPRPRDLNAPGTEQLGRTTNPYFED